MALLKWAKGLVRRGPWTPLRFPTSSFDILNAEKALDEERLDGFKTGSYYPVAIGDLFAFDKYQVVGKISFRSTSTVWLARGLRYVPCC